LRDKFKSLAATLGEEADATTELPPKGQDNKITEKTFRPREALMARANSLKKAVKSLIDQTESGTCVCVRACMCGYWLTEVFVANYMLVGLACYLQILTEFLTTRVN